jgi:signal peptidase I
MKSNESKKNANRGKSLQEIRAVKGKALLNGKTRVKQKENIWLSIIYTAAIALVMRSSLVEAFTIPTGSMKNTVLVGDYPFVNKTSYFLQTPKYFPFTSIEIPHLHIKTGNIERGDVIVFEYPGDRDLIEPREKKVNYIKRCVGLPGDTIKVVNQQLYVNGNAMTNPPDMLLYDRPLEQNVIESQLFPQGAKWNIDWYGPIRIPKSGDVIHLTPENFAQWRVFIEREKHTAEFDATGAIKIDGKIADTYTVERDYLWMMGDNREQSEDSRTWGFMPVENVVGKALIVYWSRYNPPSQGHGDGYDPDEIQETHIRWNRIGNLVN